MSSRPPDPRSPAPRGPGRPPSFRVRAAATSWRSVPRRGFLGLSLALHGVVLAAGAGAALWAVGSAETAARPAVAFVSRPAPEPPSRREERVLPVEVEPLVLPPEPAEEPFPAEPAPTPDPAAEPAPVDLLGPAPLRRDLGPVAEPPPPVPAVDEAAPHVAPEPVAETSPVQPTLLHAPPPEYPLRARRLGQAGSVDCLLVVGPDGAVSAVRVLRSSGFPLLDEAARRALSTWTFRAGRRGGRAARFEVEHRVTFVLEGR